MTLEQQEPQKLTDLNKVLIIIHHCLGYLYAAQAAGELPDGSIEYLLAKLEECLK